MRELLHLWASCGPIPIMRRLSRVPKTCKQCGVEFKPRLQSTKFCSIACYHKSKVGAGNPRWKGGRLMTRGYVSVYQGPPVEGRQMSQRKLEHTLVAERALGHSLPATAVVHHWDRDTTNNSPENLVICQSQAYHLLLHARQRRLRDTGSLELKRCYMCHAIKPLGEFYKTSLIHSWDGKVSRCKPCTVEYFKRYRSHSPKAPAP